MISNLTRRSLVPYFRLAFALGLALLPSCSFIGLKPHIEKMDAHGAITIQVTPPPRGRTPTYALTWRVENGQPKDSAGFQKVRPDGLASFSLLAGETYRVGAFTDENGNLAYDAGEPLAVLKDIRPLLLGDPRVQPKVWKLTLRRDHGLPHGTVIVVPKENKTLGGKLNLALGDVVPLDEKRFTEDEGGSGLWRPLDFLTGNAFGIYFLEPYDPKRIPVLFVYGIGGSPQDMRYLMEHLDRSRYQPWFFHYPSGMRLERVAQAMATGLNILRERDGFKKCYVVAHSMGGLVAHAAIDAAVKSAGVNFVPKLVTISTPWGGHQAAAAGIRHMRKPVPSWLDVAPGSDFLLGIYAMPLPRGTTYYLIYGSIEGGPIWLKGENDGVVTVASETDPRIKRESSSVTHFPNGHVEILNQRTTLTKVLESLR
jgi:pimeloyl-ACP methyl ester carboxylesterase